NFTASKTPMELLTRRVIHRLEGEEGEKHLDEYTTPGTERYERMVAEIQAELGIDSLRFNTLDALVESIGLPKCKVCTHCFDGSSHS
ncbi:MAG: amidophosphoribosyltransferase, partial [Muribaculaceae bacterium]|nr:amidophosphoribosyltransferase [Muribaculaceae bacterium]